MARRIYSRRAELFAEKIMDWGNLIFVGFVIGQFVPDISSVRWGLFLLGVCSFVGAYAIANQLLKGVTRL